MSLKENDIAFEREQEEKEGAFICFNCGGTGKVTVDEGYPMERTVDCPDCVGFRDEDFTGVDNEDR